MENVNKLGKSNSIEILNKNLAIKRLKRNPVNPDLKKLHARIDKMDELVTQAINKLKKNNAK